MAKLKDLSMVELAVQWHVFDSRIEKLEKRLNRMLANPTKKDMLDLLKGRDDEIMCGMVEAMNLQESVEYWLKNRGTTEEQIVKWNITPKYERFDNYPKI